MSRRVAFYRWFRFKVLKQDPTCFPSGLAKVMSAILFPIETLYCAQDKIRYFPETDTYLIRGAKIGGYVFDRLVRSNNPHVSLRLDKFGKWEIDES